MRDPQVEEPEGIEEARAYFADKAESDARVAALFLKWDA